MQERRGKLGLGCRLLHLKGQGILKTAGSLREQFDVSFCLHFVLLSDKSPLRFPDSSLSLTPN